MIHHACVHGTSPSPYTRGAGDTHLGEPRPESLRKNRYSRRNVMVVAGFDGPAPARQAKSWRRPNGPGLVCGVTAKLLSC